MVMTRQRQQDLNSKIASSTTQHMMDSITLGVVVDTNDPQQQGRVRAVCQRWGDSFDNDTSHIPWAMYATPFGGQVQVGTRGPGIDNVTGGTSYGMWAVPKVGAWAIASESFHLSQMYDPQVLHYAAIDACATVSLLNATQLLYTPKGDYHNELFDS